MTVPVVDALPVAPLPTDPPATFVTKAATQVAAQATMVGQINTAITFINTRATTAEDAASLATTKSSAASLAATAAGDAAVIAADKATLAGTHKDAAAASAAGLATAVATATTKAGEAVAARDQAVAAAASVQAIALGVSTGRPSVRPTLLLDFANSRYVDSRITATRSGPATRTGPQGLLTTAASGVLRIEHDPVSLAPEGLMLEDPRTNSLSYSQDFDNAVWIKGEGLVGANLTAAPDGSMTADKFVGTTSTNAYHYISQVSSKPGTATTYTGSIYVKDAGYLVEVLVLNSNSSGYATMRFNPSSGTVAAGATVVGSFSSASHSVEPLRDGWYRICLTATTDTDTGVKLQVTLHNGASTTFTANGSSGVFLWGAQLEAGECATSYIPSLVTHTGRTSTGTFIGSNGLIQAAASGVARYSYNPLNLAASPALLLEAAATNLLTYSEQFDNAVWVKARATVTTNAATAPDGTTTADKLVEDTTAGNTHFVEQAVATVSGTTYTYSVYVKPGERTKFALQAYTNAVASVAFDLLAVTASNTGGSIVACGGGWYRCSLTFTSGLTGTCFFDLFLQNAGGVSSYTGDGTSGLFVWGAQLEAGAYATSYIPTTAAAVPRSADTSTSTSASRLGDVASMTGTNFSSWFRRDEGTFVVEFAPNADSATSGFPRGLEVSDGGNNALRIYARTVDDTYGFDVITAGVSQAQLLSAPSTVVYGSPRIVACAYKGNDIAMSANGQAVQTDTSAVIGTFDRAFIGAGEGGTTGRLNGCVRRVVFYPKRLSNAELQALSSQ